MVIFRAFRVICEQGFRLGVIDPYSAHVLGKLSPLSFNPAAILALFKLRYEEMLQVSLERLFAGEVVTIVQHKTDRPKKLQIDFLSQCPDLVLPTFWPEPCIVSYGTLASRIKAARVSCRIALPKSCKKETHLFRHLFASWASARNVDMKYIRKVLGHAGRDSILSYVHDLATIQIS
jgi:integrase